MMYRSETLTVVIGPNICQLNTKVKRLQSVMSVVSRLRAWTITVVIVCVKYKPYLPGSINSPQQYTYYNAHVDYNVTTWLIFHIKQIFCVLFSHNTST